ncbi:adenosylmethionine decarboxylase [Pseudaestuariivita atlantica]|uniref:S-adenosylmethionine decarboxylase n=1 Tax=Pseudaestuariivita atlantica TaxID=1317121 RepID=A0A0L1JNI5_9RHOB|nr:adenosylmethionine decarboxylase [Pseudaestuariivita atlantica]KNG93321.1 S-adenosylmethionine decarboxylase [Pseudaestuariivita atlantica]
MTDHAPGVHLLIDMWGADGLTDASLLEQALRTAADAAGATILKAVFHAFPDRAGVTGILVLAESHISVHTWPEKDFAAFDIFVCGAVDAEAAAGALRAALNPSRCDVTSVRRGAGQSNHVSHPSA